MQTLLSLDSAHEWLAGHLIRRSFVLCVGVAHLPGTTHEARKPDAAAAGARACVRGTGRAG